MSFSHSSQHLTFSETAIPSLGEVRERNLPAWGQAEKKKKGKEMTNQPPHTPPNVHNANSFIWFNDDVDNGVKLHIMCL